MTYFVSATKQSWTSKKKFWVGSICIVFIVSFILFCIFVLPEILSEHGNKNKQYKTQKIDTGRFIIQKKKQKLTDFIESNYTHSLIHFTSPDFETKETEVDLKNITIDDIWSADDGFKGIKLAYDLKIPEDIVSQKYSKSESNRHLIDLIYSKKFDIYTSQ